MAETPAPPTIDVQELIAIYELAKNHWSGQCFGFTGAPESVQRGGHEAARDGFDAIAKRLAPFVMTTLKAEFAEASELARRAEEPPAPPDPPALDEELKNSAAVLLIELAFLVPKGTNINDHTVGRALVRYQTALLATERATVARLQQELETAKSARNENFFATFERLELAHKLEAAEAARETAERERDRWQNSARDTALAAAGEANHLKAERDAVERRLHALLEVYVAIDAVFKADEDSGDDALWTEEWRSCAEDLRAALQTDIGGTP